jgi:glutathione synthase/RimK-type ligase-like ATP-grasp enzyme
MLDLIVLHEHPEWQKPLFAALAKHRVAFAAFDLKRASFDVDALPSAKLYFNQASPSAYVRGNTRAVPLALSYMRTLELAGARVLNGADAFAMELSKSAQGALMRKLGIAHPRSLAFNDVETALANWNTWPALLKPEQGGSGARMFLLEGPSDLSRLLRDREDLWQPDNLLLLQEYFPVPAARGIVRLEFLDGELLYAMRVISHGAFNLCPSEVCNPASGEAGACEIPETKPAAPVEFHPYPEVPPAAVEAAAKIMRAAKIDVGGIEYLEAQDGRFVFYDVNANSNLRAPIAQAFGFDPFDRVAKYLMAQIAKR